MQRSQKKKPAERVPKHGTKAHLELLRSLFVHSATWALSDPTCPQLTSVTFFAPEQVIAARRQQAMEQVMSEPGLDGSAVPIEESPEMKRLREKAEAAPTGEESEHFMEEYYRLANLRLAYHSS